MKKENTKEKEKVVLFVKNYPLNKRIELAVACKKLDLEYKDLIIRAVDFYLSTVNNKNNQKDNVDLSPYRVKAL